MLFEAQADVKTSQELWCIRSVTSKLGSLTGRLSSRCAAPPKSQENCVTEFKSVHRDVEKVQEGEKMEQLGWKIETSDL